jgi:ComF family protein
MRRFGGALLTILRALARLVEDTLIPPACAHCGRRKAASLPLCRTCLRVIRDARPEEDEAIPGTPWARAVFRLTPPLHGMIHGFKYRDERRHARFLCAWLRWRKLWRDDLALSYDALAPVPLHPARRRERGYNQAALIAEGIARAWTKAPAKGVPLREDLLRRVRHTGTQTRLGGRGRASNLDGAFRATEKARGLRILLIDDVFTTGSTLSHCRDALLAAGAARVDALVLARVEKDDGKAPLPDFEMAVGFLA